MRINPNAQKFQLAVLILSIGVSLSSSCTKKNIIPNTSATASKKADSTTAALDTLPSFYSPAGLAVDATGNVYVADYGNNLIRKITPGGLVSTLAGNSSQGEINATGILAAFNQPTGVAVDASGYVYVADAGNNLIRLISTAGAVSTLAGSDSTGSVNGPVAGASFFNPAGIALDPSSNIYVADAGNNQIRKISHGLVSTVAGNGLDTLQTGIFDAPTGVAADGLGNVFVANYLNSNILEINPAGSVSVLAGTGAIGAANGPGNSATFYFPNSVAADAAGNLYVSDGVNNLIRKIAPNGTVSTFAGSGAAGAIDSTGTAASFNGPAGLAVDAGGNVYVADANNNLIRKINPAGVVTTIAGSGLAGARNGLAVAHRNKRTIKPNIQRFSIFMRRRHS